MGSSIQRDLRTVPNILSLCRIGLLCLAVPMFFYVSRGAGIVLAVIAGMTDYFDGYLARRLHQVTRLGEILDQFCDICFESFLMTIATLQGFFPPYFIFIYLFRELWVTCIRRFMAEGRINIPSSLAGKAKTNFVMWGFLPSYVSLSALVPMAEPYLGYFGRAAVGAGLVFGYVSAVGYTKAFVAGYSEAADRIH
jgi:CDP-diacylglycerol--glycerol-3-phosphate 3-phosphatidyltransferase